MVNSGRKEERTPTAAAMSRTLPLMPRRVKKSPPDDGPGPGVGRWTWRFPRWLMRFDRKTQLGILRRASAVRKRLFAPPRRSPGVARPHTIRLAAESIPFERRRSHDGNQAAGIEGERRGRRG